MPELAYRTPDGTAIAYERHGAQGTDVLLLPGLLGAMSQWRPMLPALSAGHRIVLADLRGHGASPSPAAELRPDDMAADALGLLDHLGISRAVVAGYSLGGYVGLLMALRAPERVAGVLMHGTKVYWTPEAAAGTLRQLDPEAIAAKVPAYAAALARDHGEGWAEVVRRAARLVERMPSEGLEEAEAARVACPVRVSVGDRDELVPVGEAVRLYRALPGASLQVLPGVRHPLSSADPAGFAAGVGAFVASIAQQDD